MWITASGPRWSLSGSGLGSLNIWVLEIWERNDEREAPVSSRLRLWLLLCFQEEAVRSEDLSEMQKDDPSQRPIWARTVDSPDSYGESMTDEDRRIVQLALGRIIRIASRPYEPGDDDEYTRCLGIILDAMEGDHVRDSS